MVAFRCAFCGNADHERLGSLVSDAEGATRKVETCGVCRGYLKNVTTLRAWASDEVALADLATVDLDLAALDRGYVRPPAVQLDFRLRSVAPLVAADAVAGGGRDVPRCGGRGGNARARPRSAASCWRRWTRPRGDANAASATRRRTRSGLASSVTC
jgi:hypothetical protein